MTAIELEALTSDQKALRMLLMHFARFYHFGISEGNMGCIEIVAGQFFFVYESPKPGNYMIVHRGGGNCVEIECLAELLEPLRSYRMESIARSSNGPEEDEESDG